MKYVIAFSDLNRFAVRLFLRQLESSIGQIRTGSQLWIRLCRDKFPSRLHRQLKLRRDLLKIGSLVRERFGEISSAINKFLERFNAFLVRQLLLLVSQGKRHEIYFSFLISLQLLFPAVVIFLDVVVRDLHVFREIGRTEPYYAGSDATIGSLVIL